MPSISKIRAGKFGVYDIGAKQTTAPFPVDGMGFDGSESISRFGQCTTAANTAAKTVQLSNNITLQTDATVYVQFIYGNTASNPTLNVNSTGAKAIMLNGTTAAGDGAWAAGEILELVYDGTYWQAVNAATGSANGAGRVIIDDTLAITGEAADAAALGTALATKQDIVPAVEGQYMGFNADGHAVAITPDAQPTWESPWLATSNGIYQTILDQYKTATITNVPVASFNDGAENIPVKALTVDITPVQYLNGYDNPWPAGGGKNFLPIDPIYNTSFSPAITRTYDDNVITATGTVTVLNSSLYTQNINDAVKGKGIVTISSALISGSFDNISVRVNERENETVLNRWTFTGTEKTFTANDNYDYSLIIYIPSSATVGGSVNTKFSLQLELGSAATSYAPYSNICPISGRTGANVTRTGKNLVNTLTGRTTNGVTFTRNADGTVSLSDTATANAYFQASSAEGVLLKAGTYYISGGISSAIRVYLGGEYVDGTTFTAQRDSGSGATQVFEKDAVVYVQISVANGTNTNGITVSPMISVVSGVDYAPYTGTTIPISWQSAAGTVYGGTLDVTTGLLTVTHNRVNFDNYTGTISKSGSSYVPSGRCLYWIRLADSPNPGGDGNPNHIYMKSSIYDIQDKSYLSLFETSKFAMGVGRDNGVCMVGFNVEDTLSTTSLFRTWVQSASCDVWYPLKTPQTYQLTPTEVTTLLNANNIWSDTGNVNTLTYRRSPNAVIDEALAGN